MASMENRGKDIENGEKKRETSSTLVQTFFRFLKRFFMVCLGLVGLVGVFVLLINLHIIFSTNLDLYSEQEFLLHHEEYVDLMGDKGQSSDYTALIFGAGIWGNHPSPMLKERLDTGIALYKAGIVSRVLLSGDGVMPDYDEVRVMKQYMLKNGVPEAALIEDRKGIRTFESVYRARKEYDLHTLLLVTQKYHLYRAQYIAKRYHTQSLGVYCDKQVFSGQLIRDIREWAARVVAFFDCFKALQIENCFISVVGFCYSIFPR